MKTFGYIVASLIAGVVFAFYGGWALSVLWGWFMVPVFGLPSFNTIQGAGICCVATYLTAHITRKDAENADWSETLTWIVALGITKPTVFLVNGWIIHQFI